MESRGFSHRMRGCVDIQRLARQPQVLLDHSRRDVHQNRNILRRLALCHPFQRLALALGQGARTLPGKVRHLQV